MSTVVHLGNRLGEVIAYGEGGGSALVRFTTFILVDDEGAHRAVGVEEYVPAAELEVVRELRTDGGVTTVELEDGSILMFGTQIVPGSGEATDADDGG